QIADPPKDQRAEWPDQKPCRIGCKGREQGRSLVAWRKKQCRKERRQDCIEVKVVPLENGSQRRGENDFLFLRLEIRVVLVVNAASGSGHVLSSLFAVLRHGSRELAVIGPTV